MIDSTPRQFQLKGIAFPERLDGAEVVAHRRSLMVTREALLWLSIGAVALFARAWALSSAPLSDPEAALALQALALSGNTSPLTTAFAAMPAANPLFTTWQALWMSIFGATDATARWPSALAGVALCMLPALLRCEIGPARALAFGGLLALSPTLWFIARQSDGAQVAWTLAFGAWCMWATSGQTEAGSTRLVAVGWALAGLLLACGVDAVTPALTVVTVLAASNQLSRLRITARAGLIAAGACVIGATGFGLRLPGLGDMFNGYALWFAELTGGQLFEGSAGMWPLPLLRAIAGFILYEPLVWIGAIISAGVLALNWTTQRDSSPEASSGDASDKVRTVMRGIRPWLAWAGTGLGLHILTQSRTVDGFAPVVIGCAGLASAAIERALIEVADRRQWVPIAAVAGISATMLVYGFMGVLLYAGQGESTWLLTALIALAMVGGIAIIAALTLNAPAALAGVGIAAGVCLTLYTLSAGVQLTQTGFDNPAEPYIVRATLPGLRDLRDALANVSARASGEPLAISIELSESAPPSLKWAARDWRRATITSQPGAAETLLTPVGASIETDYTYIGSAFRIASTVSIRSARCDDRSGQFSCYPLARWLALRTLDGSAATSQQITRWALWLRQDVAARYSGR